MTTQPISGVRPSNARTVELYRAIFLHSSFKGRLSGEREVEGEYSKLRARDNDNVSRKSPDRMRFIGDGFIETKNYKGFEREPHVIKDGVSGEYVFGSFGVEYAQRGNEHFLRFNYNTDRSFDKNQILVSGTSLKVAEERLLKKLVGHYTTAKGDLNLDGSGFGQLRELEGLVIIIH